MTVSFLPLKDSVHFVHVPMLTAVVVRVVISFRVLVELNVADVIDVDIRDIPRRK
jgi:hypothetical protein